MRDHATTSLLGMAAAAGLAAAPGAAQAQATPPERPNILLFMVDDLGWMDSSVYGSEYYRTPNMERLRERGMMFTDAYAANPLCSPTRASIMTGQFPGRMNFTTPAGHLAANPDQPAIDASAPPGRAMVTPNSRHQLSTDYHTIAEAAREAGYDTAFFGKWHLGSPQEYWPEAHGFDINIGGAGNPGPGSYFSPYRLNNLSDGPPGEHITDRMADEFIAYLDGREGDDDPWMAFVWQWPVHGPWQGVPELMEHYRANPDPRGEQRCPTMGAMIESMDASLGEIMDHLDATGEWDDTLFVFFSDNGGNVHIRVADPGTGVEAAPTSNAPLANGKAYIHEGGVRVPMIVSWPGVVEPGATSNAVVSSIDFYPTFAEIGGASVPEDHIVDGISLANHFAHGAPLGREAIFCHFPHDILAPAASSVRRGDWKLIRIYGVGPGRTNALELYNLRDDIGETNNLAATMPELAAELDALIEAHLAETGSVVPFPNPAYAPGGGAQAAPAAEEPGAVHGWIPRGPMDLSASGGVLRAEQRNAEAFLASPALGGVRGPARIEARMRSQGSGLLAIAWAAPQARFRPQDTNRVEVAHDGQWREESIGLDAPGSIARVRLIVGDGAGIAEFDWVRIVDAETGKAVAEWDFGGPAAGDAPLE